jgi:hypothetical protein
MKKTLLIAVALGLAVAALGQRPSKEVHEYSGPADDRPRKSYAGKPTVDAFGAKNEPPPKPFPWVALGVAGLVVLIAAPIAYTQFMKTRTELESLKTFGRGASGERIEEGGAQEGGAAPSISRRPAGRSAPAAGGRDASSPRDVILGAVSRSRQWVTAEWVARASGVPATIAADTLGTLAEEGRLQEARDSAGNPVYRVT